MSKTILLADDSATIRKIVELTFSASDYRVETVGSGAEALERFAAAPPDVVLADATMPAPGGYELCRRVKQSAHPVPVLLLAGTFEPFDEQLAERCAADGHLVKPFESTTLVRKIEALLATAPRAVPPEPVPERAPDQGAEVADAAAAASRPAGRLDPADIEAIAREVVRLMADDVVREVAATVLPEIAERVVRERIRQIEAED